MVHLQQHFVIQFLLEEISAIHNYISRFDSVIDVASGVTSDYYYVKEGVIYSYIIELRDRGLYGFVAPPNEIKPTAIETWNGIRAMMGVI